MTAVEHRPESELSGPPRGLDGVARVAIGTGSLSGIAMSGRPGVGLALVLASALVATLWVTDRQRSHVALLTLSGFLLPLLVIRDNGWLALCILASVALVIGFVVAASSSSQSLRDFRLLPVVRREPRRGGLTPPTGGLTPQVGGSSRGIEVVRGTAIAMFVVWIFWTVLASADEVFASVVDLGRLPFGRIIFGGMVAAATAVMAALSAFRSPTIDRSVTRRLGSIESSIVLVAVAGLFASFVAIRLGRLGEPLSEDAWRSEVRSGFFQLLFVAALTIALVLALRRLVRLDTSEERRRFRLLIGVVVALAMAIDVVALQRIAEYVDRNFQTPLRWWSFGFGLFLLVLLAVVLARVLGVGASREWVTLSMVVAWLVFVGAMGLSNPDQRIAAYNFDNPRSSDGVISVLALSWLSEDATPEIVANLDLLRPLPNTRFERMVAHLCETEPASSWRDWNPARATAASATDDLCGR